MVNLRKAAYRAAVGLRGKPSNPLAQFGFAAEKKLKQQVESMTKEQQIQLIRRQEAETHAEMAKLQEFENALAIRNYAAAEKQAIKEMERFIAEALHGIQMPPQMKITFVRALAMQVGPALAQLPVQNERQRQVLVNKIFANSSGLKIVEQMARNNVFKKGHMDTAVQEILQMVEQIRQNQ